MKQKITVILAALVCLCRLAGAQVVQIDGFVFLSGESNHVNINIVFERVAPDFATYTATTDSSGKYSIGIGEGVYNIKFQKEKYLVDSLTGQALYSNATLNDITLLKVGLSGEVRGVINKGEYEVTGNLNVSSMDTLIIEAGTILKFGKGIKFNVTGTIIASGTSSDRIIFKNLKDGDFWGGINLLSSYHGNMFSYSTIEYAGNSGIYADSSTLQVSNSIFSNNVASEFPGHGPAMRLINHCNVSCFNSYFYSNDGHSTYSIAVYLENSKGKFYNLVFANNFGGYSCLRIEDSEIEVSNVTIFNDADKFPGVSGIQCFNSTGKVRNSIAVGGRTGFFKDSPDVVFEYCNAWDNDYKDYEDESSSWLGVNVKINSNNDSTDAWNNMHLNPDFILPMSDDFGLNENSPCIDAGTNDLITFSEDISGNRRLTDGNEDGLETADMGAFESHSFATLIGSAIGNDMVTIYPNPASRSVKISLSNENSNSDNRIIVYDMLGKTYYSQNSLQNNAVIDVGSFPEGVYLVKLKVINEYFTKKLMIVH